MLSPELLERRANGPRSERWRAVLDGHEVELRVVKAPFATDAARFVERTEWLTRVDHPSLRMVRGALVLPDGRPAAVLSLVNWVPLSASPKQPPRAVLSLGIELADALAAVHAAGLVVGPFDGDDLYPGEPAVLDASLAGLAADDATPEGDVGLLCDALLTALGGGKDVGPLESTLQRARGQRFNAAQLRQELEALATRFQARTVSGTHEPVEQVEVVEPDLTGQQLQHWRLEKVLGEGAMARVYLATDERTGAKAALKVLKQEHLDDAEHVQRFIQEVRAVEAISNPHIVKVNEFGDVPFPSGQRVVFCAMELLEGQALSDAMNHEAFGVVRAVRIAQQTARALHAAHQIGVVHRDVKPENLFLMRDGAQEFVKVLDFGVAKLLKPLGNLPKVGTKAGIVVGTPEYMAPEQALGTGTDPRVDVYAVGLVLYELLSGEQPFKGETFGKLVLEIAQTPVPPLPEKTRAGERLPPGLAAVVLKCLEKQPDARFSSAAELADALEPFATPRWSRSQMPAVRVNEDAVPEVSDAELAAAIRPSRAPLLVAAVVVGLALLGTAFAVFGGSSGEAPAAPATKPAAQVEAPKPVEPAPEPPKPPPPPTEVTLEVQSTPEGAKVKREGAVLGVTPLRVTLPRSTAAEMLTLELPKYVAVAREVRLDADVKLEVQLEPQPAKAKKPAPKKKKTTKR